MRVLGASVFSRPRRFVQFRPLVLQPARWRQGVHSRKAKLLPSNADARKIISVVFFITGGVLCTYVAGSYTWMYLEQKKLLHEWKTERAAAEVLTKISIPRIGLQAVVLEGTSSHSLLLGPAHMSGSAVPGATGNAVIAGHRDTFFRRIHSLTAGDDIYVVRSGQQFHYVVTAKRVVEPTDLSVLEPTREGQLTLITCYPTYAIGPAPERLIVTARLNSREPLITRIPDLSSSRLSRLLAGLY